jgi:IS605 OrfB family transposase
MRRTYKCRLYPSRKQREILTQHLDLCRELFNAGLQERIDSYKHGTPVRWLDQQAQLASQRKDFQHQLSHRLVQRYGTIAVEALHVKGLAHGMLAKSVHDVGWGRFLRALAYKAESAGRKYIAVDPSGTSQTCLCGAEVPKRLSDREQQRACLHCLRTYRSP